MKQTGYKTYLKLARLHQPIGVWLLLLPCWWGLALSSPTTPQPLLLILFAAGAFLMRSAGCVYNDLIDQDLDRKVKRTASRPLAKKEISSREAVVFFVFLLTLSSFLLFSFPFPVILTGLGALILVLLYPWMKQLTYWPQAFLGFTFNIGILMGWLCYHETLSVVPLLFYGGAIFWAIGYDTIYAFQDKEDDILAGIRSSAIVVSDNPKAFLSLMYGSSLALWTMGGYMAHLNWIYVFFLSIISAHFLWQIITLKEQIASNCLKRFKSNTTVGLLLFIAIVFSRFFN